MNYKIVCKNHAVGTLIAFIKVIGVCLKLAAGMAPQASTPSLHGKLGYLLRFLNRWFAKALLKTFSEAEASCKSFYGSKYERQR